jgi:hypothetical protein
MSHSLCVMGVYDEVKMTVPMVVRYVHSDKKEKRNTEGPSPYWYKLNTTSRQADTTSTGTWKATDTTSTGTWKATDTTSKSMSHDR